MTKKLLYILVLLTIFGLIAFLSIKIWKVCFARQIELSIEKGDELRAVYLINTHPESINTYPSLLPSFIRSAMSIYRTYPLISACSSGSIELVGALVENGANVNCKDECTPLECVLRDKPKNWYIISDYLLENGANYRAITDYAGNSIVLNELVQFSAALDSSEREQMHKVFFDAFEATGDMPRNLELTFCLCADEDDLELLTFLADKGISSNSQYNGMTALMFAAMGGNGDAVELLIDFGADVNVIDDGWSALLYACRSGTEKTVKLLLEAGADSTLISPEGLSAYELAVNNQRLTRDVLEKLLS